MRFVNNAHQRGRILLIIVFLLGFFLNGCAQKQAQQALPEGGPHIRIPGCYSTLKYHEESGDVLGWEFFIVLSKGEYHVLYQESEGEPTVLLLLPLGVDGNRIRFTIPPGNRSQLSSFEGMVTADSITGTFSNGLQIRLERKKSYWQ